MYSDRETSTDKSEVFEPNDVDQPEVFSKFHLSRKTLWDLSRKKETYRNVLLYYPVNYKPGNTGAIPKRRKDEIADNKAGKIIKTEMKQDSLYNLHDLYQMSNDKLDSSSGTSISLQKSNIKVKMLKVPFNQKAEIKDQINDHVENSNIECFKKCSLVNIKNYINCPYNIIEVDIFNIPPLQKVLTVENKTAKITEVLQQQPEIIRNSDDDRKMEVETNKSDFIQPDIIKVAHHFTESTQKPESLLNTRTQTSECSETKQLASKSKFPTTSSFKKRQLELHRLRVQVEQKRLEFLELKISRERREIEHEQILFEKRLQIKTFNFDQVNEDTDV